MLERLSEAEQVEDTRYFLTPNGAPLWTPTDVRSLRAMWAGGSSFQEMSVRFNRSLGAIKDKARQIGLQRRPIEGGWSQADQDLLKALWEEGLTYRQIGQKLHKTRNAISGMVHRLGFPLRDISKVKTSRGRITAYGQNRTRKPIIRTPPPVRTPVRVMPEESASIGFNGLTSTTCRFPIGEPGTPEFGFCGKHCESTKPYCSGHMSIAYYKPTPKKRTPFTFRNAGGTGA